MFYTVYKTTNKINGKIYFGAHEVKGKNPNDSYMGSGTHIKKALKKYGKENFEKEILFFLDNEDDMNDKEREVIAEHDGVADPNCYNVKPGGEGGAGVLSSEARLKISKKRKEYFNNPKNRQRTSEATKNSWKNPNRHIQQSKTMKDRIYITNGEKTKTIFKDELIPNGWYKGRHYNTGSDKGEIYITDGTNNKRIPNNNKIPKGWRKGKSKSSTKGTIWITDGTKNKMIQKDTPIPEGWMHGMIKNKS